MAEIKNSGPESKQTDLKKADARRAHRSMSQPTDLRKVNRHAELDQDPDIKVKKRLPLAVDILAGIVMLALVCAILVGSYMLFRYYSNDYDGVSVTYTVAFDTTEDLARHISMRNEEVFIDTEKDTVYFGKIIGVETVGSTGRQGGRVYMTVKANAKYRKGEGYSIGDERLAVGSSFRLRCIEKRIDVTVTDIVTGGK